MRNQNNHSQFPPNPYTLGQLWIASQIKCSIFSFPRLPILCKNLHPLSVIWMSCWIWLDRFQFISKDFGAILKCKHNLVSCDRKYLIFLFKYFPFILFSLHSPHCWPTPLCHAQRVATIFDSISLSFSSDLIFLRMFYSEAVPLEL